MSARDLINVVTIQDVELIPMEHEGRRVLTMGMMDAVHKRPDGTAGRNFRENRERLIQGEDYVELNQPDEIRRLGFSRPQGGTPASVLLLTETGYSMLVKSFTDDLAWDVQRQLVKSYFTKSVPAVAPGQSNVGNKALDSFRQARALEITARVAAELCAKFPSLGLPAQQGIYASLVNTVAGQNVMPLPVIEKMISATEVGNIYGISKNAVGKLANEHGLKIPQYGEFMMDKSRSSDKQMPSFRYNAAGVARIGELVGSKGAASVAQGQLDME